MNVLKIKETTHNVFIVIKTSSNDCVRQGMECCLRATQPPEHYC